jgi:curved DNA-binding protein
MVSLRLPNGELRELKVRIPPGIRDGMKLKVIGKGVPSPLGGGEPGDLLLKISLGPHPEFTRIGDDIEVVVVVRMSEALLGTRKTVMTPEGEKTLKIPVGVKPGLKMRLKSLGFPVYGHAQGGERGDLYAVISVEMPVSLDARQLEVALQLQEVGL